mgnify:CR=1 FL=1
MKKNKEGKTLSEVLKENQIKMRKQFLKEKKKKERKTIIGMIVVGALLVGMFYLGYLLQNNALEQCGKNHDRDYCLVNL